MSDPLSSRVSSGLATVRAWDEDVALLQEVRDSIPLDKLIPERFSATTATGIVIGSKDHDNALLGRMGIPKSIYEPEKKKTADSPYAREDDDQYEGDDLLLKRLTLWFKFEVMTWVNNPPCSSCGNTNTTNCGMRGPTTEEEKHGGAGRVEVYNCTSCDSETTFPRYNSARKLFETRSGRCGEYANCFGLYCRSLGFETRYISDFTDHVWVEVWSDRMSMWLHADSCEGKINEPGMYEHGWGKKLNYVVAVTNENGGSVVDVTGRYSRKLLSDEMLARRREITMSEEQGEAIIEQINASLRSRSKASKTKLDEVDRKIKEEKRFFHLAQQSGKWEGNAYSEGRISGSLAWRASRDELRVQQQRGAKNGSIEYNADGNVDGTENCFHVESFHPQPFGNLLSITVTTATSSKDCINVCGVNCAIGSPNSISIVTVDEQSGCILQSRSFSSWEDVSVFAKTVPNGRIVAIHSDLKKDVEFIVSDAARHELSRIGGFDATSLCQCETSDDEEQKRIACIGQINYSPSWATSVQGRPKNLAINVTIELPPPAVRLKLCLQRDTAPIAIYSRLPEDVMPLRTQLLADEAQKRAGFLKFIAENIAAKPPYAGYATKDGAPVYLVTSSAFPLQRYKSEAAVGKSYWNVHHYLPEPLVPEQDELCRNSSDLEQPAFDIPIDLDFFRDLLGSSLLKKDSDGNVATVDTASALHNARLVALYFSAHWCGPCRRFTPMLIELYTHLKEEVLQTHGLEVVFVSSDRDQSQFNSYYGEMPWLSLPFDQRSFKQSASMRYGVRGIPALVVLDAVTGAVVSSAEQSRSEVSFACQRGDDAIAELLTKNWLEHTPPESQSIMESLALSCLEVDAEQSGNDVSHVNVVNSFLVREDTGKTEDDPVTDPSERIKKCFAALVREGFAPNAAAAKAIQMVAEGIDKSKSSEYTPSSPGELSDAPWTCTVCVSSSDTNDAEPCGDDFTKKSLQAAVVYKKVGCNGGVETSYDASSYDKAALCLVIETAKKYLANAQMQPYTAKFRRFKLSNKVFDRVVRVPGGLDIIAGLGFAIYCNDSDFMASIPLAADLTAMQEESDKLLAEFRGET